MYGNGTIVCWKCLWPVDSLMDFLVLGGREQKPDGDKWEILSFSDEAWSAQN